jgi:hypothetical protein
MSRIVTVILKSVMEIPCFYHEAGTELVCYLYEFHADRDETRIAFL